MVNLKWEGKKEELKNFHEKQKSFSDFIYKKEVYFPLLFTNKNNKISSVSHIQKEVNKYSKKYQFKNLLIYGDNLTVLRGLLKDYKEKISLIYIDPPFFTGGDFSLKLFIGKERNNYVETLAYDDTWKKGLDSYIDFLYKRIFLMRKLLSPKGSLYLHLDWHTVHYMKIILDEIFGSENFRNEIIWAYPAASARTKNYFVRSYDSILFYTKTDEYTFNDDPNIYQEYSERVKNALKEDEKGLFYYRGGSHNGKKLSRKVYVDKPGVFPRDVWNDIPYIRANTKEYQGFTTQKPERLLKRIILASSNKGDIVADFFSGSGTALAVAEKLARKWIGNDINWYSIHRTKKRLLEIRNSHDIYQWKKKYKKEAEPFKIIYLNDPMEVFKIPEILMKDKRGENKIKDYNPRIEYKIHQDDNKIKVELSDYEIPSQKELLGEINDFITTNLDLIDFWSIDFDYNDKCFQPSWFSFRNSKRRKIKTLSDTFEYSKGNYNLMINIIDCFGKESTIYERIVF